MCPNLKKKKMNTSIEFNNINNFIIDYDFNNDEIYKNHEKVNFI